MPSSKRLTFAALTLLTSSLCHAATLAHRYSFDADASDSVGGNDGILIDDASVSGGELILDGAPNGPSGDSMGFTSTIGIGSNFGSNGVTFEAWYTDQGSLHTLRFHHSADRLRPPLPRGSLDEQQPAM